MEERLLDAEFRLLRYMDVRERGVWRELAQEKGTVDAEPPVVGYFDPDEPRTYAGRGLRHFWLGGAFGVGFGVYFTADLA